MNRLRRKPRRAFATIMVLWVVGIMTVILVSLQTWAWRGAAGGREAVALVRAKWAARAGVEAAIAKLGYNAEFEGNASPRLVMDDLAGVAHDTFDGASYQVNHWEDTGAVEGPADAHAKININTMDAEALMLLPGMTEDIADAILDWVDADEDVRPLGAETPQYEALQYPYAARNGPMRSIQELESVYGVTADMVRGEDWNLNGVLDPEENDGDASWPPDNADGKLDAGWSALVTASSIEGGTGANGEARLDLSKATSEEIVSRLKVSTEQADAISAYATTAGAVMDEFIRTNLSQIASNTSSTSGQGAGQITVVQNLTTDELALLLDECDIVGTTVGRRPGRLNLNTCAAVTLEYLPGIEPAVADAIIAEREGKADGFASIMDLLEIPSIDRARLADLSKYLTTRSNTFIVTSRGRDSNSGLEVEITAVIDRSALPVVVRELIVR